MKLYDDHATIDWIKDSKRLINHRYKALRALSTWLVILLIGTASGIVASWISIAGEFFTDIRHGYCADFWYLNRQFCCQESQLDDCAQWRPYGNGFV